MRIERTYYYLVPYCSNSVRGVMEIRSPRAITDFNHVEEINRAVGEKHKGAILSGAPFLMRIDKRFVWR